MSYPDNSLHFSQTVHVSRAILEKEMVEAAHRLKLKLIGNMAFGWNNDIAGSGGQLCKNEDGKEVWLKLKALAHSQTPADYAPWQGWKDAQSLDSRIPKPAYLGSIEHWRKEQVTFSTLLISYIKEPICSTNPWIAEHHFLTDEWLSSLKKTLGFLSVYPTKKVSVKQDLITRRIHERFGTDINSTIDHWETVHGDLHWANLTQKTPYILDWDKWGTAPQGLEIGFLYCFSLNNPSVSQKIKEAFAEDLSTQDAYKSLLFICCELLRMNELHNDHPHLVPALQNLSHEVLLKVRT
ncbi:MAG: hypothetical protein FJX03_06685 [Alphaproteobacteria bacterium]|nr:hypothetical protein [Alphaproteobacteria bacterium]